MNGAVSEQKHYHEIDILYALGAILAILGHSHPNDWNTFPGQWVEFIYLFHMPLFFSIAGFLLASSKRIEQCGYAEWLGEKAIRLLTPYFVLSLLALVPKYALEHSGFAGFTPQYLLTAFFAPRQNVWGHFWFLPVLLLMYAIFGLLRFQEKRISGVARWVIRAAMLAFAVLLHFVKPDIQWLGIEDLCTFSVYFILGCVGYQATYVKIASPSWLLLLLAAVLSAVSIAIFNMTAANAYRDFLLSLFMLAACWMIGIALRSRAIPMLGFIARYVFTFYIYSWPAQAIAERLCSHLHAPWTIITPVMFAVGVACPAVLILLYQKCGFLHRHFIDLVLGMRR